MNTYEIAVLYHPDLEIDLDKATSKIEKIIKDNGGNITNTDNWGKRKLTYPIKKQEHAIYVFYAAELPAQNVQKIEGMLNITSEVIRYIVVRPDFKAMAKAEQTRTDKAKKAAARAESTDGAKEESKIEEEGGA